MTIFPNVPNAPGVPAVARAVGAVVASVVLLTEDTFFFAQGNAIGPQWGIFDQNLQPVIIGDSCVGIQFRKSNQTLDYPIEQGSFSSFNKVTLPYDFKITFTKGGSIGEKQNFLSAIDAIVESLVLFNAVTPEFTYTNANPIDYDYDRSAVNGATLLTVSVYLKEIRQTLQAAFTNTQAADGSAAKNSGPVQPQTPGSQATTPAVSGAPGAITTSMPATALTNSTGNIPPASTAASGAAVVYDTGDGSGPQTSFIKSVGTNGIGYTLTNGQTIGKSLVTSITPAGYTTVQ